jgi:Zn-dependent peptidase ImmA (M78 family)
LSRWTPSSLEKALKELAVSPKVSVTLKQHNDCSAESSWYEAKGDIFMTIDPERAGRVRCFIHELLHVVLEKDLMQRFTYPLEEEMVESLEALLYQRGIALSPRKMNWWRRALRAKLGDDPE